MMETLTNYENKNVEVNSYYFQNGQELRSFPRTITVDNSSLTFMDGLQVLVRKGHDMVRLFDMTDGSRSYRLRNHNNEWTLLSSRPIS